MWSLVVSVVVDKLLNKLTSTGLYCIGFADYIVKVTKGKYAGIQITEGFCSALGPTINSSLTTVVPFTRRKKLVNLKTIQKYGEVMKFKQGVKFLRITLDHNLLWNRKNLGNYQQSHKSLNGMVVIQAFWDGCTPP